MEGRARGVAAPLALEEGVPFQGHVEPPPGLNQDTGCPNHGGMTWGRDLHP